MMVFGGCSRIRERWWSIPRRDCSCPPESFTLRRTDAEALDRSRASSGFNFRTRSFPCHFHSRGSLRGISWFSGVSRAVVELRENSRKTLIL
jgi:hypothetical protein